MIHLATSEPLTGSFIWKVAYITLLVSFNGCSEAELISGSQH